MPENHISTELSCHYLLFVATGTEKEELKKVAKESGFTFSRKKGRLGRYYDLGTIGISRVLAVRTQMGPFSYGGSASKAIYYMAETQAVGIISVGMSFGTDRSSQKIGDVLVSKTLLPYDNRDIVTEDGKMKVYYHRVRSHKSDARLFRLLRKESEQGKWKGRVHLGALLTGGARIRCRDYRNELRGIESSEPIVGGEMEGVGLLSVSAPESPSWIVAKGICDFADEERDEIIKDTRSVACRNSALFVLNALKNAHNY